MILCIFSLAWKSWSRQSATSCISQCLKHADICTSLKTKRIIMDAMVTKQILTNYKIFSDRAKNTPDTQPGTQHNKGDAPIDKSSGNEKTKKSSHNARMPGRHHRKVKRIQGQKKKRGYVAASLLNVSILSNGSKHSRRRQPRSKHETTHLSNTVASKVEEQVYKSVKSLDAICTSLASL